METIISYIESLFKNYPDTPEIRRARTELLNVMEDKYNELKSQGKSENEVIGIVISEFGNIDEIVAELNIVEKTDRIIGSNDNISNNINNSIVDENEIDMRPVVSVTSSQAEEFIQKRIHFGNMIALGVFLCIISPTAYIILDELSDIGIISSALADSVGMMSLFVVISIAVSILIFNAISNEKYEHYEKEKIILDYSTQKEIEEQAGTFRSVFGFKITVGVVLCILGVIPAGVLDEIAKTDFMQSVADMSAVFILIAVAVGVSLFITAGMRRDAYNIILNKEEYSIKKTINRKKSERIIGIIAVIYWPLTLVIYIVWSFLSLGFGVSWIVWPIAGIIFGSVAATINLIYNKSV